MQRKKRDDKPYRDYSDDSWFRKLVDGMWADGSCCWWPVIGLLTVSGAVALILMF